MAAWSIPGRHRCGWERQKGGEAEPRPVCPAALAATHDHKKAPKEKQKHMTHNVTLAKKVTSEKLPCVAKLPCRSSAVVLSGKPLAQHKLRNQAGKAVSLWLRLPLFPACTHADCSSNYKMGGAPAKPEEHPNGEAGRPQDANPSPKARTKPKTIFAVRSSKPEKKIPSTEHLAHVRMKLKLHLAHAPHHIVMPRALPKVYMRYVGRPPAVARNILKGVPSLIRPSCARHTARVSPYAVIGEIESPSGQAKVSLNLDTPEYLSVRHHKHRPIRRVLEVFGSQVIIKATKTRTPPQQTTKTAHCAPRARARNQPPEVCVHATPIASRARASGGETPKLVGVLLRHVQSLVETFHFRKQFSVSQPFGSGC